LTLTASPNEPCFAFRSHARYSLIPGIERCASSRALFLLTIWKQQFTHLGKGSVPSCYVKKPECPARKSGDEWPKWLFLWKKPRAEARGSSLKRHFHSFQVLYPNRIFCSEIVGPRLKAQGMRHNRPEFLIDRREGNPSVTFKSVYMGS
jgi:hypothetical protein